ncbi:MAG: hypothetical protein IJ391_09205 [Clostridia bacterium]|nr:hypothetical protein [Clostridia bacterium]
MSNTSGQLFRKTLNGYNKNDVNDYIENMSIRAKKREEELEARIAKLESSLDEVNKRAAEAESRDFSEEAAVYEEKIRELEEKISDCEKVNAAKSEYIEKLEASLVEKNAEINEHTARIFQMEQTINEATGTLEKAAQYDNLSRRLGEIMLGAGNTAEKIVADANEKAASLIAEASKKRDHCLDVLKKYTEKYCDKLSEVTVASAQERLDRIHSEMAEFEASITRSVMDARRQTGSVREYIEGLRQSLDTSLESILNMPAGSDITDAEATCANEPSDASVDKMLASSVSDILSQINAELDDLDTSN